MCGIIGIASVVPVGDRTPLVVGRDAMIHRGPDDAGEWWSADGCVGLAQRRLAIIDLSPGGHQPMSDVSGQRTIVFNGEIYNYADLRLQLSGKGHTFRSQSDTEVILAAYCEWGGGCLDHLNGMFAFAIYDRSRRSLFIARDRAGEKPMFYCKGANSICFASELKGLLAFPSVSRRMDMIAVDCYLSLGFIPGDRCILTGVRKLPPAHALLYELDTGISKVWRYWKIPSLETGLAIGKGTDEDLVSELEALLEDSVRRQLVADVPVGVLLSGGIDSSLLTGMAARANAKVATFTIRFPGYGKYDETEHARKIARHFGTVHSELVGVESTVDLLPVLARQFDEPVVDSSMIPTYLVSRMIAEKCKVAIGGDGGDELFGGYKHYSYLLWLEEKVRWLPFGLRRLASSIATHALPVGYKGRSWLQVLSVNMDTGVPHIGGHFDAKMRGILLQNVKEWVAVAEQIWEERIPLADSLLQRTTRQDCENYMAEDILVKVDRSSMLNSLEVRAPFLDYRVIEFAFGRVPDRLKATKNSRKILLKKLGVRFFPPGFDLHRKQGFSLPLNTWLRNGPWLSFFRDVLLSSECTMFDRRFVEGLFKSQAKRANGERLFALVMFELWRREYNITN